ncbi:hypothetical protein LINGRAPRIM_LOCUS1893 [Linum grandiflorum]
MNSYEMLNQDWPIKIEHIYQKGNKTADFLPDRVFPLMFTVCPSMIPGIA